MARIHVVEDDPDVAEWIARCLVQDGHQVTCSSSAGACLEALRTQDRPDLLVLDYSLPDGDGVGLLQQVREHDPDLAAVFVTVYWSGEVIERIAATGVERVAKPFATDQLLDAVGRALERQD